MIGGGSRWVLFAMPTKTPPCEVYPAWTQAKFWAFIRSGLRAKWTRWPPKYEAMAKVKRPYVGEDKRRKFEYQCAHCQGWFMQKEVSVDHIEPVGSLLSFDDLPGFVQRLFVSVDKLQVLCDTCHNVKTQEERKTRGS